MAVPRGSGITCATLALVEGFRAPAGGLCFDLGCGSGQAAILALRRNPGSRWVCIDRRIDLPLAGARALRTVPEHANLVHFVVCDAACVPFAFAGGCAGAVIANPPFMNERSSRPAADEVRRESRSAGGLLSSAAFVRASAHLLREGGRLWIAARPVDLGTLLMVLETWEFGSAAVQPWGVPGRDSVLVTVEAVRGSRGPASLRCQRELPDTGGDPPDRRPGG
jgi:tRNA1(Val) A37 N6-methylase TrmN6